MNLVRKLAYVALMMPVVYCSAVAVDYAQPHHPAVRRERAEGTPTSASEKSDGELSEDSQITTNAFQMSAAQIAERKQDLINAKQEPLKAVLSQQLEALQAVNQSFAGIIERQKNINEVEAFKTACFASNVDVLLVDTQCTVKNLQSNDDNTVLIAICAVPAILQAVDQFTGYMDQIKGSEELSRNNKELSNVSVERLQEISKSIHGITDSIPDIDLTHYLE